MSELCAQYCNIIKQYQKKFSDMELQIEVLKEDLLQALLNNIIELPIKKEREVRYDIEEEMVDLYKQMHLLEEQKEVLLKALKVIRNEIIEECIDTVKNTMECECTDPEERCPAHLSCTVCAIEKLEGMVK